MNSYYFLLVCSARPCQPVGQKSVTVVTGLLNEIHVVILKPYEVRRKSCMIDIVNIQRYIEFCRVFSSNTHLSFSCEFCLFF